MQKNKPDYYNNLDKIYLKIWDMLNKGLRNRNSSFHIPVFICSNNNKQDGRIIVIRGVDENEKKIWFHSDIRSNKIKTLKNNPKSNFLFYDKVEKIRGLDITICTSAANDKEALELLKAFNLPFITGEIN